MRVDSKVDIGSRFSFLIPLTLDDGLSRDDTTTSSSMLSTGNSLRYASAQESLRLSSQSDSMRITSTHSSMRSSHSGGKEPIDNLVEALTEMSGDRHHRTHDPAQSSRASLDSKSSRGNDSAKSGSAKSGSYDVAGSIAIRAAKVDSYELDGMRQRSRNTSEKISAGTSSSATPPIHNPSTAALVTATLPEVPHQSSKGKENTSAKLRVLVVEVGDSTPIRFVTTDSLYQDNEINLKILLKRLQMMGHTVASAMNGQEGLDAVKNDRGFDCVLMDIQMPILDGYECTAAIRALEASETVEVPRSHRLNGRIPIFAVSASLVESRREEMINLGLDGWILKPIDFKRLQVILNGVMDPAQRKLDIYRPDRSWEYGGWLRRPQPTPPLEKQSWT